MNKAQISEYMREMGRKGGDARNAALSKARRKAIAIMGGKARKGYRKPKPDQQL